MKTKFIFLALGVSWLAFSTACTKDKASTGEDISSSEVSNTVKNGSWVITSFVDSGKDETAHFSGYDFAFGGEGTITATKGDTTVSGTWSVGNDDSKTKLDIHFPAPDEFEDLSEDWHVLQRTDTKIRLEHVSGGNGGTDLLTFERK